MVVGTTAFALLDAFGVGFIRAMGFGAGALLDAFLFAVIAFGLQRDSRVAAWVGLVLFLAERIYAWSTYDMNSSAELPGDL